MESDSEVEEHVPVEPPSDMTELRNAISTWKQNTLDTDTETTQKNKVLTDYVKKASALYRVLKDSLENQEVGEQNEMIDIINKNRGSSDFCIEADSILFRDLIEFPFTYDAHVINSFTDEEKDSMSQQ